MPSRSTVMAEAFLPSVLGKSIFLTNPVMFQTKAEACKALRLAGLDRVVHLTVSCDRFPLRVRNAPPQCGLCTSCVLPRQALFAAGLEERDPNSLNRCDVSSNGADMDSRLLFGLGVMREQVYKIAHCPKSADPWYSLATSYPELYRTHVELSEHQGMTADATRRRIVALCQKYVQELAVARKFHRNRWSRASHTQCRSHPPRLRTPTTKLWSCHQQGMTLASFAIPASYIPYPSFTVERRKCRAR